MSSLALLKKVNEKYILIEKKAIYKFWFSNK